MEVAVLGSPSLTVLISGFCGHKATLNLNVLLRIDAETDGFLGF